MGSEIRTKIFADLLWPTSEMQERVSQSRTSIGRPFVVSTDKPTPYHPGRQAGSSTRVVHKGLRGRGQGQPASRHVPTLPLIFPNNKAARFGKGGVAEGLARGGEQGYGAGLCPTGRQGRHERRRLSGLSPVEAAHESWHVAVLHRLQRRDPL